MGVGFGHDRPRMTRNACQPDRFTDARFSGLDPYRAAQARRGLVGLAQLVPAPHRLGRCAGRRAGAGRTVGTRGADRARPRPHVRALITNPDQILAFAPVDETADPAARIALKDLTATRPSRREEHVAQLAFDFLWCCTVAAACDAVAVARDRIKL